MPPKQLEDGDRRVTAGVQDQDQTAFDPADQAPALTITAMGAALVRGPNGAAIGALGAKSIGLLSFVALQPGQAAARDVLVELLWPRGDADQGRASLRQELRRMKKAMGPLFEAAIDAPPGQVALRPGAVAIDAGALEQAAEARDSGGLTTVLHLYGGPFLAPLAVAEAPFQDWASFQSTRLEEMTVDALLRLMLLDEGAGRLDRATAAARKLLGIDPFQEDVHAALIRMHAASGRIGAARQQLERCRELFMKELDEDPGPALSALIPDARSRRAAAARGDAPPIGRPAPPDNGPRRPLAALSVRAAGGADPELAAAAHQVAASVMGQLGPGCWMNLTLPDGLTAAGMSGAALFDRASCIADVALSWDGGALRADVTCARRPDGVMTDSRVLLAPRNAEVAPTVAIARQTAATLGAAFLAAAEAEAAAHDEGDADGWLVLMRAHRLYRHGGADELARARAMLDEAVMIDPGMCEGLCLLSLTHLADVTRGLTDAPREAMFRARELAMRAVRRSPDAAWPHYALGAATSLADDPLAAQSQHLHALRLAPGFAPAMGEIARGLALAGDAEEAEGWARRAMDAGPADPSLPDWLHTVAMARLAAHDWAGAAQAGAEAAAARPCWAPPALLRAAALRKDGHAAAADRALRVADGAASFAPEALRFAHPFAERALTDALADELARLCAEVVQSA